jgi:dolichol-phosphate mannosyltransferase
MPTVLSDSAPRADRSATVPRIDLIIPVYNEGANILATLGELARHVRTRTRVLICYDRDDDDTLPAVRSHPDVHAGLDVVFIRNRVRGAHGAVMAGFAASTAPIVAAYPADDDFNAGIIDRMAALIEDGCDIVCASRLMPGGTMQGAPWLKGTLVRSASLLLNRVAALPASDATSGFRMFSRRVIDRIEIESDQGFCYSIETLVKVHRLGWRIGEVPALWYERQHGSSRFKVIQWLPAYLRWFGYAFATRFMRRRADTVALKPGQN